jgi:Na+/proline symporter
VVLAAAVVLAAGALALWGWRRGGGALAYFAAARTAGPVAVGLAGTAAGLSAFVFIGGPGLFASIGVASLWLVLSAPLTGALQCWVVGEPIVELTRRHGCLTVPDLVAARFGEGWPRGLVALMVTAGGVATLAVQVKGVAVAGEVLLGVPGWAVAGLAVLAVALYTAAGGMRTGLPSEVAQGVLMATAAVGLAWAALARAGGPARAVAALAEHRPALLDAFGTVGPTVALGWLLLFGLGTCAQPHYLQKFLLLRSARSLRWLPAVMTGALIAVLTVWLGVGLGGTALWLEGRLAIGTPDQLAPAFLVAEAGPGLMTVAVVAVLAAIMSTAASLLNLVAAALTRDLPQALGARAPEGLWPARAATVGVAAAAAGLALGSARPVALLGVLGWGMLTAALLPVMVLGLGWSGASRRGAILALVTGPAVQLGLELGRMATRAGSGTTLLPAWEPGLTGAAVGVLVLVLASLGRPDRPCAALDAGATP